MASCGTCGRPVAMARPRCLYCGAALDAATVAAAEAARAAVESAPAVPLPAPAEGARPTGETPLASDRVLVLVDLGAPPDKVAAALGLSLYDARQRSARGGIAVHRVADAPGAAAEAERLRAAGLWVATVPEEEVRRRSQPVLARKGGPDGPGLRFATDQGAVELGPGEVFLVVKGPIAREYPTSDTLKRVRLAGLDPGYRFHLHRLSDERPVELDPASFEFGAAAAVSSILTMAAWIEGLAPLAPQDDTFKNVTPALAPAAPEPGAIATASALGGRPATAVHDNLAQFRRHSACRAAAEARRAG